MRYRVPRKMRRQVARESWFPSSAIRSTCREDGTLAGCPGQSRVGLPSVGYAYFSKHVADESSFGIRRPQPALCRWNRGLETRTWPSRPFVPASFMPAERRFDDYGDGRSTATRVVKPAVHWHEASGAVMLISRRWLLLDKPAGGLWMNWIVRQSISFWSGSASRVDYAFSSLLR